MHCQCIQAAGSAAPETGLHASTRGRHRCRTSPIILPSSRTRITRRQTTRCNNGTQACLLLRINSSRILITSSQACRLPTSSGAHQGDTSKVRRRCGACLPSTARDRMGTSLCFLRRCTSPSRRQTWTGWRRWPRVRKERLSRALLPPRAAMHLPKKSLKGSRKGTDSASPQSSARKRAKNKERKSLLEGKGPLTISHWRSSYCSRSSST